MNKHIFIYNLKLFLKVKIMLFWNLAFPILLATFMYLAFSNITENIKTLPIGVESQYLSGILEKITYKDHPLFEIVEINSDEIVEKLNNETIEGYILGEYNYSLKIAKSNVKTDVLKKMINSINHKTFMIEELMKDNEVEDSDVKRQNEIVAAVIHPSTINDLKNTSVGSESDSSVNILFFSVLTMNALYAASMGLYMIEHSLKSIFARRKLLGCISKTKILVSDFLANFLFSIMLTLITFLFMIFVLKIKFGQHLGLTVLISIFGTLTGLLMGSVISLLLKCKTMTKQNLIVFINLLCCFLSGLMNPNLAFNINKNLPFLRFINPAYLITDSFYALYFYEGFGRLIKNIQILGIINLIFIILLALGLRRKYNEYI